MSERESEQIDAPDWLLKLGRAVYPIATKGWLVLGLVLGLLVLFGQLELGRALWWMIIGSALMLSTPFAFGLLVGVTNFVQRRSEQGDEGDDD
jgi:hypothetical protein